MRKGLVGFTCAAVVLGVSAMGARSGQKPAATTFSGIKLVDMHARTPEQTVTLRFDADDAQDRRSDWAARAGVSRYCGLTATHTFASSPPASAGNPDAVPTQPGVVPDVHGQAAAQLAHVQQQPARTRLCA